MCGIAGVLSLNGAPVADLLGRLERMGRLLAHRGPDSRGMWVSDDQTMGLAHLRLAIIDPGATGQQPMVGLDGSVIAFNGEVYNYLELRASGSARGRAFASTSDTETILAAYELEGLDAIASLRGMFAFARWDPRAQSLVLGRDRFGVKPLYYLVAGECLYFASEIKALVPFLDRIDTDLDALAEYLTFQYLLGEKTLFAGVRQVPPGHWLQASAHSGVSIHRYWDVSYDIDYDHTDAYFARSLRELLEDSVDVHTRADVEVGAYLSGGLDSTLIAALASRGLGSGMATFHGRFLEYQGYDESRYAAAAADAIDADLMIRDITAEDFTRDLARVIYHLDHPVAGPGSFPQFEVSGMAATRLKVVLGGQGGDEIFGGYARYLVAYLEQCLRAAIDGTSGNGTFVVTLESILPNLGVLREYQPLLQQFWAEGLFGPLDERYFRLIDRGTELRDVIAWDALDMAGVKDRYLAIFNSTRNVRKEAYFDSMTHFEFKTLLPALLQVEDRMSMAHGLESRVPFLDHPLVEFAASVPADVKFKGGTMKRLLRHAFAEEVPREVRDRRDKMGFPVPMTEWFAGPLRPFATGILESLRDRDDPVLNGDTALASFHGSPRFSRRAWALISLEMWQQQFHDRAADWRWRP